MSHLRVVPFHFLAKPHETYPFLHRLKGWGASTCDIVGDELETPEREEADKRMSISVGSEPSTTSATVGDDLRSPPVANNTQSGARPWASHAALTTLSRPQPCLNAKNRVGKPSCRTDPSCAW